MRKAVLFVFALFLSCTQKSSTQRISNCNPPSIWPVYGKAYRDSALNVINNAKKFVYVWMFEIANYREGDNPLLAAVCRAKKRGVDVKVLIEGGEDFLGEKFYKKQYSAYRYLKNCGVNVRIDKMGKTTHVKMLLADTNLIIGSTNWTYYGLEKNNELNVLIRGKDTRKFKEIFLKEFKHAKGNKFKKNGGQEIEIRGTITFVSERVSKRGKAYTIFKVRSGKKTYRIFMRGHHHLKKGERVYVKGTFYRIKRVGKRVYHNEIEARYIRRI